MSLVTGSFMLFFNKSMYKGSKKRKGHHLSGVCIIDIFPCISSDFCTDAFQETKKHSYRLVRFSGSRFPIPVLYTIHSNDGEWWICYIIFAMDSFFRYFI